MKGLRIFFWGGEGGGYFFIFILISQQGKTVHGTEITFKSDIQKDLLKLRHRTYIQKNGLAGKLKHKKMFLNLQRRHLTQKLLY